MEDKNFLDPEVSLSGNCHTCNEPILFAQEHCPYCGIKLDHEDMVPNVINHFLIDQAITSANSVLTFDVGVYIFLGTSLLRFLIGFPMWFSLATSLAWVLPFLIVIKWFRRHGKWDSRDEEYLSKRKQMKHSFWLWLAAHFFNAIIIVFTQPMKLD